MNNCKCTYENPTCSCSPQEVIAYKDSKGKLHTTKRKAAISDISECIYQQVNKGCGYTSPYGRVSSYDIDKVLAALEELNLINLD